MLNIEYKEFLLGDQTTVEIKYKYRGEVVDKRDFYILKQIQDHDERCCICYSGGREFQMDWSHLTRIYRYCCTPICLSCLTNPKNRIYKYLCCKKVMVESCFFPEEE